MPQDLSRAALERLWERSRTAVRLATEARAKAADALANATRTMVHTRVSLRASPRPRSR